MSTMTIVNNRQHFRLSLAPPLCSQMTIVKINEQDIEIGETRVLIEDIGPGGLRFTSLLKLPVHPHVVLEFETELLSTLIIIHGYVVRACEFEPGLWQYGVKFTMDEDKLAALAQLLNIFTIRQKKTSALSGRFLTGTRIDYLNGVE